MKTFHCSSDSGAARGGAGRNVKGGDLPNRWKQRGHFIDARTSLSYSIRTCPTGGKKGDIFKRCQNKLLLCFKLLRLYEAKLLDCTKPRIVKDFVQYHTFAGLLVTRRQGLITGISTGGNN